jgi:hypothetical protein
MTTVTRFPTADTAISGTWTTPTNVQADDGSVASITRGTTKNSQDDRGQGNYGFDASIPAGAVINSVQINVEHRVQATGNICFLENFASISGTPGATNSDSTEPTTLTVVNYSSYARPGGGSWTRNDLLDGTFTTTIRARNGNNATSNTWEWDYISVTVDYSEAFRSNELPQLERPRQRQQVDPVSASFFLLSAVEEAAPFMVGSFEYLDRNSQQQLDQVLNLPLLIPPPEEPPAPRRMMGQVLT